MDTVSGLQEFVTTVVAMLADEPDRAAVTRRELGKRTVMEIRVAEKDMPRLLGRGGNTIMAIRNLAAAAAVRDGLDVGVEVME
jgi:predicted RNA-binding protein YlqC (UPF0109 family)